MHHLPLDTGGGGGCQVITPLLGFSCWLFNYDLRGVSMRVWTQMWDVWMASFFFHPSQYLLRCILCFKTQRSGNQQRTPECTKIYNPHGTAYWHLFRFFFLSVGFLPLLVVENNASPMHFICRYKVQHLFFFFFLTKWAEIIFNNIC